MLKKIIAKKHIMLYGGSGCQGFLKKFIAFNNSYTILEFKFSNHIYQPLRSGRSSGV